MPDGLYLTEMRVVALIIFCVLIISQPVFAEPEPTDFWGRLHVVMRSVVRVWKELGGTSVQDRMLREAGIKAELMLGSSGLEIYWGWRIMPDRNGHRFNRIAARLEETMHGAKLAYSESALRITGYSGYFDQSSRTVFMSDESLQSLQITSAELHEVEHARLFHEQYGGKVSDYSGFLVAKSGVLSNEESSYSKYQAFGELSTYTLDLLKTIPAGSDDASVNEFHSYLNVYGALLIQTADALTKTVRSYRDPSRVRYLRESSMGKAVDRIDVQFDEANDAWIAFYFKSLPEAREERDALVRWRVLSLQIRVLALQKAYLSLAEAFLKGAYSELKPLCRRLRQVARVRDCESPLQAGPEPTLGTLLPE